MIVVCSGECRILTSLETKLFNRRHRDSKYFLSTLLKMQLFDTNKAAKTCFNF